MAYTGTEYRTIKYFLYMLYILYLQDYSTSWIFWLAEKGGAKAKRRPKREEAVELGNYVVRKSGRKWDWGGHRLESGNKTCK